MPNSPGTALTAVLTTALQTSLVGPGNGELIEDDDVNDLFQKLLNGLNRVGRYSLTALAQLTSLTGPLDGERFHVRDFGIYEYRSASVVAVSSPWIIDGPGSVGRFHHTLYGFLNVAAGAGIMSSANRTVGIYGGIEIAAVNTRTGATTFGDAAAHTLALGTLNVGDKVIVNATVVHHISLTAHNSAACVGIVENGSLVVGAQSIEHTTNDPVGTGLYTTHSAHNFVRTVATAGVASLIVRHRPSNAGETSYVDQSILQAIVVRP